MSKQMKLESLELKNFKGVPLFKLNALLGNARVFGDNATGKTTLFDGFVWLLFDKDSQNKKDFAIKTLDASGNELHMLEHEVEGVFWIDGTRKVFRKVYSEKWTKKKGTPTATFSGHTTEYYVNGVPVKKGEYAKEIEGIIQEDLFKLLTSPTFFNEQLKWQDRRKTLLEICGDISDEDVIASDVSLAKLPAILQGRAIEDHRKIIASRKTEINRELDRIPVRIDEINRNIPDIEGLDKKTLEVQITQLNTEIDEHMTQISNIKNGKAISEKQMAIQQIEMGLLDLKRNHESGAKDIVYQKKARLQEEQSNLSLLTSKLENFKNQKRHNDTNIKSIEENLKDLRQEWYEINGQEFVHNDACECPACGQTLPEDQVTAAREKALSQFNLKKAQLLEAVNAKGKQGAERKEAIAKENEKLTKEYEKVTDQINEKQHLLKKLQNELVQLESSIVDITENPEYVKKLQEKQAITAEIQQIKDMSQQSIQDIQLEIIQLKQQREQLQEDVGKFALVAQSQKRVQELQQQERELTAEYEKLEEELYLTEEFIRAKVNLLEKKINSKFKYARFNLFKTNINGGLEEVCETTYEGVPYGAGLNNAARINVGLDIINTLSEHYGFCAPIFIDNSEAVTKLIDTNAQVISLVVSEADKALRVETDGVEFKEVI